MKINLKIKTFFLKQLTLTKGASGFTLIETMVAMSILLLALASPMNIAQNGLSSAMFAQNSVVAQYLAQSAVEFVKNVKDNNGILDNMYPVDGYYWLNGLQDCFEINGCEIDDTETTNLASKQIMKIVLNTDGVPVTKYLKYNKRTGLYSYTPDSEPANSMETTFKRIVRIDNESNNIESSKKDFAKVTVDVSWEEKGGGTVTVIAYLTNWRE